MMRALASLFCVLLTGNVMAQAQAGVFPPGSDWSLRVPSEERVAYRGVPGLDTAGVPHRGILYGPGAAGFIAGVITHAVVVDVAKDKQKAALQEKADRVLFPYRMQLAEFRYPRLLQMALDRVPGPGRKGLARDAAAPEAWLFTGTPVFSMTQDGRALILDNEVSVFRPGEATQPAHTVTIRVVSRPRLVPLIDWSGPEGDAAPLLEESAQLVAHALQLAMRDAGAAAPAAPMKTVRYPEGGAERIERAQPVEALCERVVLRNLRGWLLSVPAAPDPEESPACSGTQSAWR